MSVLRAAAHVKWHETGCEMAVVLSFCLNRPCVQMPFLWEGVAILRQHAWLSRVLSQSLAWDSAHHVFLHERGEFLRGQIRQPECWETFLLLHLLEPARRFPSLAWNLLKYSWMVRGR